MKRGDVLEIPATERWGPRRRKYEISGAWYPQLNFNTFQKLAANSDKVQDTVNVLIYPENIIHVLEKINCNHGTNFHHPAFRGFTWFLSSSKKSWIIVHHESSRVYSKAYRTWRYSWLTGLNSTVRRDWLKTGHVARFLEFDWTIPPTILSMTGQLFRCVL